MSKLGWIKLDRDIMNHFIWQGEKFTRGQAWIDLILLANHEDRKIMVQGNVFVIKRGQHLTSVRKLADRWCWCEKKTLEFLKMLEREKMILRDVETLNATLVTVVNYGKFQSRRNTKDNTECNTEDNTQYNTECNTEYAQTRNKKEYKESKEVEEEFTPTAETWEKLNQEDWDD